MSDKQFRKKNGKHTKEYGLNPRSSSDRQKIWHTILDIVENAKEVVKGDWRGQIGTVLFYIKNDDVVVAKESGEFITILKDGVNNARVKNARKH